MSTQLGSNLQPYLVHTASEYCTSEWVMPVAHRLPMPGGPQPGSLAGRPVDPGAGPNFVLVPYRPAGRARGTT